MTFFRILRRIILSKPDMLFTIYNDGIVILFQRYINVHKAPKTAFFIEHQQKTFPYRIYLNY